MLKSWGLRPGPTPFDGGDFSMGTGVAAAFASRGYATTQPLEPIEEDWPMDYADPLASSGTDRLPAGGRLDRAGAALDGARQEIKEWQAVMDDLRDLPQRGSDGLPILRKDEAFAEVRAIRV